MNKYNTQKLNKLSQQLHDFQLEAGFDDSNRTQRLMLAASEIFEAFEAYRKDKYANIKKFLGNINKFPKYPKESYWKDQFESLIKDSHEDEIADAVIRLLAYCGENNIDIEWHVDNKMKYNELRGYKFGGKKF